MLRAIVTGWLLTPHALADIPTALAKLSILSGRRKLMKTTRLLWMLAFACSFAAAQSTSPIGSYGFLANGLTDDISPADNNGFAVLGGIL